MRRGCNGRWVAVLRDKVSCRLHGFVSRSWDSNLNRSRRHDGRISDRWTGGLDGAITDLQIRDVPLDHHEPPPSSACFNAVTLRFLLVLMLSANENLDPTTAAGSIVVRRFPAGCVAYGDDVTMCMPVACGQNLGVRPTRLVAVFGGGGPVH